MNRFRDFHIRHKYWFFSLAILLALLGISSGTNLPISLNLTDLLPDNRESVKDMRSVSNDVGGIGHVIVLVGPVSNPEKYLPQIAEVVKKREDVKYFFFEKEEYQLRSKALYIIPKSEFKDLRKHAKNLFSKKGDTELFDLGLSDESDRLEKKKDAERFFIDFKDRHEVQRYYLSKDKKYAMFLIKPTFDSVDLDESQKLADYLDTNLKDVLGSVPFNLIGRYIEKVHDRKQFQKDIIRTGLITLISLSLILVIGLGTFRAAAITNMAVIIALGWSIGIALIFVGQINILTSFLLAILGGLGAEYGIHLIRRYYQSIKEGFSHGESVNQAYSNIGRALLSASITSASAFLILYISDFRGFSELGVIAGLGILSIFLVYMLTFPVVGQWLRPQPRFKKTLEIFGYYPFSIRWKWMFIPVIIFTVWGLTRAEFEYDFERMHDLTVKTQKMNALAKKLFGKSLSPSAIQAVDEKQTKKLEKWLEKDIRKPVVNDVISLASLVPRDMKSRYRKLKKLKKLVDGVSCKELEDKTKLKCGDIHDWINEKPYKRDDLPPQLKNAFGKNGTIVLSYPAMKQSNDKNLRDYSKVLISAKDKFKGIKVGSDTLVFVEIIDHIIKDGKIVLILFAIGAFLVFWLDFKSFYSALLLESQLVCGMLLLVGLMGLVGERFTILNVAMIPAVLAAGIDMGVHVRHRELVDNFSSVESARYIAQAVQLSAITSMIGFGSLFFAEAGMLRGIAWISVLGQISMYLVCMVFFPVFRDGIANIQGRRKNRRTI